MSVDANGHLIYGFIHTDETSELFTQIQGDNEEGESFEELHQDLQAQHEISLSSVGYDGIDILSAYSINACAHRGFDSSVIASADLTGLKTVEYNQRIHQFLEALGIDAEKYKPGWLIMSYMD